MVQKAVFMERVFTLHNLRSASAAAMIELLLVTGIAAVLIWQQVGSGIQERYKVPPVVIPDTPLPLPQHTVAPLPEQTRVPQLHEVQPIPSSIPTPTAVPVSPPPRPLVPDQRTASSGDLAAGFNASMLRAINAQKSYPKLSMLKGEAGETAVSFDYVDGVVSNVRVDKSSGFRELDQAAVQAVQRAALPPKPAALAGTSHFVVRIDFNLGG